VHDLRWLRDDPGAFDRALARRGLPPAAASILAVDSERRALETTLQERQAERNRLSREIGEAKRTGADASALLARVAELKDEVKAGEERLRELQARLESLLASHPNRLADDVPDGPDAPTGSSGWSARRAASPSSPCRTTSSVPAWACASSAPPS
jgi:seryl-tRNA synthetase